MGCAYVSMTQERALRPDFQVDMTPRREAPRRRQPVEGALQRRLSLGKEKDALAHVVDEECRQDEPGPADADRFPAEVPHVGVERLGSGDAKDHGPEDPEPGPAVSGEETDGLSRVQGASRIATTTNQSIIVGPKMLSIRSAPRRWNQNRKTRSAMPRSG